MERKNRNSREIRQVSIPISEIEKININDINNAVIGFCNKLNISGSVGEFDLYTLLQTYLTKPESREKINHVISEYRFK